MFENIGAKLRVLGYIVFGTGVLGSIYAGAQMWRGMEYSSNEGAIFMLGWVIMAIGCILSYLGSLLIFAKAELLENTRETAQNTEQIARYLREMQKKSKSQKVENVPEKEIELPKL